MVAPSYSEQRRAMAKKIGLGSKGRAAKAKSAAASVTTKPKRIPRKRADPA
jgi:predicted transcriptional regulator